MKYAIISDIHGNLLALNSVLEDAQARGVGGYIIVGDYCLSNPFPDACITRIRNLENAHIIRGNEERYLENLIGKDQSAWTDGQMQISYWCYQNISIDNLEYLLALPTKIDLVVNNVPVHIAHSSDEFIGKCEHASWGANIVAERYNNAFVSREQFREDIHDYLNNSKEFEDVFGNLAEGIYIFGHTHIQWCYQSADRKKILINPGSCGLPLDCIKEGMPYTILNLSDEGNIQIEEIRVPVDKEEYFNAIMQSTQFEKANIWCKVIMKELRTSREHLTFFLQFVEEYATQIGDIQRPYSVQTWEKAYELWDAQLN